MRRVKLVVVGFGNVGRALIRLIALKRRVVAEKYGLHLDVVGIADSKGIALKPSGFEEYELLKLCEVPRSGVSLFEPYARAGASVEDIYNEAQPDIHVELTPANYVTGEPGLSNVLFAISRGVHVVTANKAPLALAFSKVMSSAAAKRVLVKFGGTVMGGTPLIEMLTAMRAYDVEYVEGILNATSNYILSEMCNRLVDFEEALKKAQAVGVAEADPSLDVEGVDAAAKLVILSNVVGKPIKLSDVHRESLARVSLRDVVEALRQGYVLKQIASINLLEGVASVRIARVPREDILAKVEGTLNCIKMKTNVSELVLIGKGGGGVETAHTVLDDILSIAINMVDGYAARY